MSTFQFSFQKDKMYCTVSTALGSPLLSPASFPPNFMGWAQLRSLSYRRSPPHNPSLLLFPPSLRCTDILMSTIQNTDTEHMQCGKNNVWAQLKKQIHLTSIPKTPLIIPKCCLLGGPLNKKGKGAIKSMLYSANEITDKRVQEY